MRKSNFFICVENKGYEVSLERWKVYQVIDDEPATARHHIRVIDESGEDYLYPKDYFEAIELPQPVEEAMTAAA